MGRAWRSSASRANGSDGMPTPVEDFRHHPTPPRVFKATVDLPSFIEPLDASTRFRYGAGRLPGRCANCQRLRLPLSQTAHKRGGVAGPFPKTILGGGPDAISRRRTRCEWRSRTPGGDCPGATRPGVHGVFHPEGAGAGAGDHPLDRRGPRRHALGHPHCGAGRHCALHLAHRRGGRLLTAARAIVFVIDDDSHDMFCRPQPHAPRRMPWLTAHSRKRNSWWID
jgi:hypothetical protein